jgi:Fcf2 pre-rRNA processing
MQKTSTAGEKWFDLPATEVTPGIKRDLQLLQMRDVLDPKRFYRASSKKLPKYFQVPPLVS